MTEQKKKNRLFPVTGPGEVLPPNYDRSVRAMSDAELEDEILGKHGDAGYQLALLAEHDRRAKEA